MPDKVSTVRKERRNTQKHDRYQKQREKRRQRLRLLWVAAGVVLVLIVIGVVLLVRNQSNGASNSGVGSGIPGVVNYGSFSRNHVLKSVHYAQNPPVGGDHSYVWLNCGIYAVPVKNENAVHSMEHGAVWITYQPDLPGGDVDQLRSLVQGHSYAILSPYVGLPAPVVASAWGVQLKVNSASDPRLHQFLQKYEQGPQTQEPGAACSGGLGTPVSQ